MPPSKAPSSNPPPSNDKPATVQDMVGWLTEEADNRGVLGGKTDWRMEEIISMSGLSPNQKEDQDGSRGGGIGLNIGLQDVTKAVEQQMEIKELIRNNTNLLPEAIKEIDRQLLEAGMTPNELDGLEGEDAYVYQKLGMLWTLRNLSEAPPKFHHKAITDNETGFGPIVDIYHPKTDTLMDFEQSMREDQLSRFVVDDKGPDLRSHLLPKNWESLGVSKARVMKKAGVERKVWTCKLFNEGGLLHQQPYWQALCDEDDWTKLIGILNKDKTKTAVFCHEATLESMHLREEKLKQEKEEKGKRDEKRKKKEQQQEQEQVEDEDDWEWDENTPHDLPESVKALGYELVGDDYDFSKMDWKKHWAEVNECEMRRRERLGIKTYDTVEEDLDPESDESRGVTSHNRD